MHAIHFDRRPFVAALGALALTGVAAAGAAALSEVDLSGGDDAARAAAPVALPSPPAPSTQPVWVSEPLAPPALMR